MTLVETLVALGTSCTVLFTIMTVAASLSKQTDRDGTRMPINSAGRAAMDNILYYIRGTKTIDAASTATKVIVSAPSYDPAAAGVVTGSNDIMTFEFNSANKTLLETVTTSSGTVRKQLSQHTLAKDVQSVVFSYYGRQTFPLASFSNSAASSQTFILDNGWKTGTTPAISIVLNGASYTVPSAAMPVVIDPTTRSLTVSNVPGGVGAAEIRYELDTTSTVSNPTPLSSATQINVKLIFMKKDSRLVEQSFTITGSARLCNIPSS